MWGHDNIISQTHQPTHRHHARYMFHFVDGLLQYALSCRFPKVWQGYPRNLWFWSLLGVLYWAELRVFVGGQRTPSGAQNSEERTVWEPSGGSLLDGAESVCARAENLSWGLK